MTFDQFRFTLRATIFEWLRLPERALAAWEGSYHANPSDLVAIRSIAWTHAQKARWPAAALWFERALQLDATHADSWFNLGYAHEKLGQPDAALAAFQRTTELNPKHDRAWYGLGMLHAQRGEHHSAADALRHAADLQPMNGAAWYALGMAHYHARQPEQVTTVIEHCLTHDRPTAKRLIQDAQRSDLVARLAD
jgi:tetratricopeptide (TPR) repeat protein